MGKEWIPDWMRKKEDDAEDKTVTLPDELKNEIANVVKASSTDMNTKLGSITEYIEEMKREREEAKAAAAAAEAKKASKPEESNEDLTARLLEDPRSVLADAQKPLAEFMLGIKADQIKDQVFRDRAEEFPYYDGEVKTEVDKILASQSLKFRNDPVAVANTYYTVVGKKQKEISEGKVKSRFASATGVMHSTTPGANDDPKFEVTDEIRRAARLSGIALDDYMTLLTKAAKAGEVDFV